MNEYINKALEIVNEWNALTPEQQLAFCTACVCKAIKSGRTLKPGWDMEDATQSTFEGVLSRTANIYRLAGNIKKRADKGMTDTLAALICRSANSTMQGIAYRHQKDSKNTVSRETVSADGEAFDLLQTIAAVNDTEEAAIIRATLKDFYNGLDDTSKTIFAGMVNGMTERELAPAAGISNVAVHKRMVKIRAALAVLL